MCALQLHPSCNPYCPFDKSSAEAKPIHAGTQNVRPPTTQAEALPSMPPNVVFSQPQLNPYRALQLRSVSQSIAASLILITSKVSNAGKAMGYQHMAMMGRLPKAAAPHRWLGVWQASESYEGSEDQHFECALSVDGHTWTRNCHIPLNTDRSTWVRRDVQAHKFCRWERKRASSRSGLACKDFRLTVFCSRVSETNSNDRMKHNVSNRDFERILDPSDFFS